MFSQEPLNRFIDDLLQELENDLLQNPSTTHAIQSLDELKRLKLEESRWLKKIFKQALDNEDLEKLEDIGFNLKRQYQINLHDIYARIDLAQHYCTDNFHEIASFADSMTFQVLLELFNTCRKTIAKGYFKATIREISERFANGFFGKHTMRMHRDWLVQLEKHLQDVHTVALPAMEHSQCEFGRWLNSLEAKLILHSTADEAFNLRGNILLAHRTLHEQASLVSFFLKQESYFKAVNHFEILIKAFLLLDKYIDEAEFNYLSNSYQNFIEFVINENRHQKTLDYYFVVHYGLINGFEINARQKLAILNELQNLFKAELKKHQIDFINLNHANKIHVVLSEHEQINFDRRKYIDSVIKKLSNQFGQRALEAISVNLFELEHIESTDFMHFDALLNKMITDECHSESIICEVDYQAINQYSKKVKHDILTLGVIHKHINERSFVLHYQPIVNNQNECEAVECLIRLPMQNELIAAEDFLSLVEYYQLTLEIDQIVFELIQKNIQQLKGVTPMLNVNIYPDSLGNKDFIKQIISLSKVCKSNGIVLMIEITEHETLTHDEVITMLHQEHEVNFAVDDFGTGYSNLAKLAELAGNKAIQVAKLDGATINGIETHPEKLHILEFITEMISKLGLQPIIAEFVDNKEKLAILEKLPGEFLYQGYYFSHPLPLEDLVAQYSPK
ncbi:MAG: EAL domain-containing protein [Thiomicrorhabdus sp.]|nr:EAL domain-containing protein [Thiomicrorhabdus sp.]